jgi:hypothetical protein
MVDDDDDVYLINYNKALGYKVYLHTNTDQPERHNPIKITNQIPEINDSECMVELNIYSDMVIKVKSMSKEGSSNIITIRTLYIQILNVWSV